MSAPTDGKPAKKPPKPFHRPLKPRTYRKKLANRIFLEPDREFLDSITTTDGEGRIILARELSKEERKRVTKLRKAAAKNRRGPRTTRLAILAVLVGAVLVFNIVFKDQLVTRGAEQLLEGVFLARAELTGVRFSPLRGEMAFSSLAVADADQPMRNLFELSTGRLQLDSWQLVNGHIIIDDLTVDGLRFNTPRESSGALEPTRGDPDDGADAGGSGADGAEGTLVDRIADALPPISFADLGLPDTLDAEEFLRENLDALETTAAVQAISDTANGFVDRWRDELQALTDEVIGISDDVQELAATDFAAIRSVDAALSLYDDAGALKATVTGLSTRVESEYNALVTEATAILDAARAIPLKAREDYESLLARIPDVRAEGKGFVVGLVEPYVREALGAWYDRILRGLEVYQRLTADSAEREPRTGRRRGTDVSFASTAYPRFLLSSATLGVGETGNELSARVRDLSTDPDIVGVPAVVNYRQAGRAGTLAVDTVLDGRTAAAMPFALAVATSDTPLDIRRGLEMLDLSNVTGTVALDAALSRQISGAFDGALDVRATGIAVDGTFRPNSLGEFVADLLNEAGTLWGQFAYTIASRNDVRFSSGQTNLDDLVADAVRDLVDSTIAVFREELNLRLNEYLNPVIDSLADRLDGIVDIETSAEELLALVQDREAAAAEVERFARDSITAFRNQLEAEARAALDAARAEAEARAQAAIDAAEEEARRAAAEAEAAARRAAEDAARDAAGDAADTIRDRIPLPRRR